MIISGKQILTLEKLEILALGTTENLNYGESLTESIVRIKSVGAIPVLPWGVGKSIGKRGKIIKDFIENNNDTKYFLGDNSGRPSFWLTPKLFKIADNKEIIILRGSDPLPISSQEKKIGKFGFYVKSNFDLDSPAKNINELLLNLKKTPDSFGNLETPIRFFKDQIYLQLKKYSKE